MIIVETGLQKSLRQIQLSRWSDKVEEIHKHNSIITTQITISTKKHNPTYINIAIVTDNMTRIKGK